MAPSSKVPTSTQLSRRWTAIISAALIVHIVAVVSAVLASPSGPWPMRDGSGMSTPPQFAFDTQRAFNWYVRALRLNHNHHYSGNRPDRPVAKLAVPTKDSTGRDSKKIVLPDPQANLWVQRRQKILTSWLADDQPARPPIGEMIPAPNMPAPSAIIWDSVDNHRLRLRTVPLHLMPRDRPVFRPSEWSMLLARAYSRRLSRVSKTDGLGTIRLTYEAIPPAILFFPNSQPGAYDELVSDYGVLLP